MKHNPVKSKKQRPTLTLVLSFISLMVGLVWSSACVTILTGSAMQVSMVRALVLMGFSVLFLLLGIRGVLRWRAMMKAGGKRPGTAVFVIVCVVAVMLVGEAVLVLPATFRSTRMDTVLRSYVQSSFSDEDVPLPENPRFVFYHNDRFSIPSSQYPRGTHDPDQVNVVVMYTEGQSTNGVWVNRGTGQKVGDARAQNVTLYVIRLEDWALIDQQHFSEQLDYDETGINVTGMSAVRNYLNDLFGE